MRGLFTHKSTHVKPHVCLNDIYAPCVLKSCNTMSYQKRLLFWKWLTTSISCLVTLHCVLFTRAFLIRSPVVLKCYCLGGSFEVIIHRLGITSDLNGSKQLQIIRKRIHAKCKQNLDVPNS